MSESSPLTGSAIHPITQPDLDQFFPHRQALGRFIGTEVEWFAGHNGSIVGVVAEGTPPGNWGYAVLRRNAQGRYQYWDLETRLETRIRAHDQIVRTMAATPAIG